MKNQIKTALKKMKKSAFALSIASAFGLLLALTPSAEAGVFYNLTTITNSQSAPVTILSLIHI